MVQRTLLKRIASVLACALLCAQMAVAAHACAKAAPAALTAQTTTAADSSGDGAMPDCHEPMGATDPANANLCAEHCKQGQQSDRASLAMAVPPALLNALYETPAAATPPRARPMAGAWLSALVAASPPHALAHCVLRI